MWFSDDFADGKHSMHNGKCAKQAEAKMLCDRYGFDYEQEVITARQFPDAP